MGRKSTMTVEQAAYYLESVGYLRIKGVKIAQGTFMEFRNVDGQGYEHLYSAQEVVSLALRVKRELDVPAGWQLAYEYHAPAHAYRYFLLLRVSGEWEYLTDFTPTARRVNFYTKDAAIRHICTEIALRKQHPKYKNSTHQLYGTAI